MSDEFVTYALDDTSQSTEYHAVKMRTEKSLLDDLPHDVVFDVLASGGQSTVCSAVPIEGSGSDDISI